MCCEIPDVAIVIDHSKLDVTGKKREVEREGSPGKFGHFNDVTKIDLYL